MVKEGQKSTKDAYSDPQIAAGYIEANAKNPKLFDAVERFVKTLPGNRVIDIGCGPGHDAYHFADLGFDVVGVDYSREMIRAAQTLRIVEHPPQFRVGDMMEVGEMFDEDSFDGAWISASLLHIPEDDVPQVLQGVRKVVKNGGKVYIGLKGGTQGAQLVEESKYQKPMKREFIFWEQGNFQRMVESMGYTVDSVQETEGGQTGGQSTTWLNFYLQVNK